MSRQKLKNGKSIVSQETVSDLQSVIYSQYTKTNGKQKQNTDTKSSTLNKPRVRVIIKEVWDNYAQTLYTTSGW